LSGECNTSEHACTVELPAFCKTMNSRKNQNLFEIRIDLDSSYHTENLQNVMCRCMRERKRTIN
jgi:hypothetical protein